jgi:hypothetical protein
MTSIAAPRAATRASSRKPHSFASACEVVARPFRTFAIVAKLEREREREHPMDPYTLISFICS